MIKNKSKSAPYYNIGQLRVDFWNKLKIETSELTRCHKGSVNEKTHKQNVKEIIKDLKGVECFFAFPGKERLQKLESTYNSHEYTSLSNLVAETTRQLLGDSYKSNPEFIDFDEHSMESAEEHEQHNNIRKNHFEVLFVDNISEQEESKLKHRLRTLHTPNDKFSYGVVLQRSFQDAMITLLFNHNIQAVVIRYAPPYHSKLITPLIKPYIEEINKHDYSSKPETDLGPIIGELVKQIRPELDTYYVTDSSLGHLKDNTIKGFRRIFYQSEDHRNTLRVLEQENMSPVVFSGKIENTYAFSNIIPGKTV